MIVRNNEVKDVTLTVPEGHHHIRTTIRLESGDEIVFQEATIANIARAYVTIKTHPIKTSMKLTGVKVKQENIKEGYASWQLLEKHKN